MNRRRPPGAIAKELTIGEVERRSGVPASALRFYEAKGLIGSRRNAGNQRRYPRAALRRIAVIKVAQRLGIPLARIRSALRALPEGRAPTAAQWNEISAAWKSELDDRIRLLTRLRDKLSECIGCGCLSLETCPLRNPADRLAERGSGAHMLMARDLPAAGVLPSARKSRR